MLETKARRVKGRRRICLLCLFQLYFGAEALSLYPVGERRQSLLMMAASDAGSERLRPGRTVRIEGLMGKPELNGKTGRLLRQEGERWVVKVPGQDEMSLPPTRLVAEEPEQKRARFAEGAGASNPRGAEMDESPGELDEGDEDEIEEDKAPPHSRWAEEVTTIKIVNGAGSAGQFPPLYTHQVFFTQREGDNAEREHQELIVGYEEPKLEIVYAGNCLKAGISFSHSGQPVEVKRLKQHGLTRTSILNSLHTRVPMDYAAKMADVQAEAQAPFTPLGTLRDEETLSDGSRVQIFHFTADSPAAVEFVRRMQTFAVWLIETGQGIEVPDPKWNILTLYRVERGADNTNVHTMLGFFSAYRYWVYDKAQDVAARALDKFRLRLSQCIILPPFQRQGHGARLLRAFYKLGREDASVLDMSVEVSGPPPRASPSLKCSGPNSAHLWAQSSDDLCLGRIRLQSSRCCGT